MLSCLRCGANLAGGDRYCYMCGAPTAVPSAPSPPPTYMPGPGSWAGAPTGLPKRRPRPVLLGLIGVVAVLVAGAAIWGGTGDGTVDPGTLPPAATPLSGKAIVGAAHEIGSETSDPRQNTTLRAPADGPLAGMTITVPGDAYAAQTAFTVSARDLRLSGYGGKITVLTDLIVVENGGGYAASPITVRIPVTIPAGSFAMGVFLRDDGTLEPMPLASETPSSVTVMSRHFSRFFVAAIAEAALPENIGTGFRAGEDDFQTPNYGSYIAPHGHCAGQSLAEMWYFAERRAAGAPPLWGLTDNNGKGATPTFWQDDSIAYRLSSTVHQDLDWDSLTRRIMLALGNARVDQLQWDAFRYAMLITGQPQYVRLSVGDKPGGHAVVAYAATRTGLWVADPNYPGQLRDIAWDDNRKAFRPYDSGEDAASSEEHYDGVAFFGKTALVDWAAIGARWAQADSGSIDNTDYPHPVLSIQITNPDGTSSWSPLGDRPIGTNRPALWLTADGWFWPPLRATLYDGTEVIGTLTDESAEFTLPIGMSDLGVFIEAQNPLKKWWRAVDFYHFSLTAPPPSSVVPAAPSLSPRTTPSVTPTARPAKTPTSTYDCSKGPPNTEIGRMEWELHCKGIQPTASQ